MPLFLLDTTVLSNFAHVRRTDLLFVAFQGEVATSPAAWDELQLGQSLGFLPTCDWNWLLVLALSEEEERLADQFGLRLDAGESQCLALALIRGGVLCSDDRAALRVAREGGVRVSGWEY